MKRWTAILTLAIAAAAVHAVAQRLPDDERQALRRRIEQRFDVVPLTGGVALTPKSPRGDLRMIEISDTILVNGVAVSGRELRERLGTDADLILRLSYLDAESRRAVFAAVTPEQPVRPEAEPAPAPPPEPPPPDRAPRRIRGRSGDRVRIFGDVVVREDEEISGQVVAVIGDVRVDGEVGDQVVAVLGSVELGPHAVVDGDVITVGGRLHRADGARVRGSVTEVALGGPGAWIRVEPWLDEGWGPIHLFGGIAPVARFVGSTVRFMLLALLASVALVVARRSVEGSAQLVGDNPLKATFVGIAAWILLGPVLFVTAFVLLVSIVGIPLLLLLPFAILMLLLMALVGFSGTALTVGQWTRRRFGIGPVPAFVEVWLGILVILAPLLLGRLLALGGWPLNPIVFLLLAIGVAVECLAWVSGFGAVLTNAFTARQAARAARAAVPPPPPPIP